VVAKCLQSKDTAPISPLEAGLGLGLAFGPLGAIFELLKHMGLQSAVVGAEFPAVVNEAFSVPTGPAYTARCPSLRLKVSGGSHCLCFALLVFICSCGTRAVAHVRIAK
jgi:hypothetical protein